MSDDIDYRAEYMRLLSKVDTFWQVCYEALGEAFSGAGNFGCTEVEALVTMLEGIADAEDLDTLVRLHAYDESTPHHGDSDCRDGHHALWLSQWGDTDHECEEQP